MKRQSFIMGSAAALATAPIWSRIARADATSIKAAALAKGINYGSNFKDVDAVGQDSGFANLVLNQLNLVEAAGPFSWRELRPSPSSFDFGKADAFVSWAKGHGLLLSECHLEWHRGTAKWEPSTVNSSNWKDLLTRHVDTVVSRYAGKIYSWVAVNEALNPKDGLPGGLRNSFWNQAGGQDAIDTAFRVANQADPKALLLYNDYGVEYDKPESIAKRRLMLAMLQGMRQRGVPVHALGIQAHLNGANGFNAPGLGKFIDDVGALGLKVFLTEFEVGDENLPSDASTRDQESAQVYKDFLNTVLPHKNVTTIIQWSFADKYNWRNQWEPNGQSKRSDGQPSRGLPFGMNLESTPIADAIISALNAAPSR
jgi:endo-1,4-beta-xylanase